MRIYCGPEEFEQLEEHKRHLYGTSPDVDSGEEVYAVSIGELEAFASFVALSLAAVDDWEYELRTEATPGYARNVAVQMEQILQELRPHMPNSTAPSETTQRRDVARHSKIRYWLSVFSRRDQ